MKVQPGDALRIPAAEWNTLLDVAGDYRLGQLGRGGVGASGTGTGSVIVPVKNTTGATVARYNAVAIGAPIFSPTDNAQTFLNQLGFDGAAMSASYFGKFAVLSETLLNGKIGPAVLQGVTVAQITVVHADHDRVDVDTAGGAQLVSAFYGAGEILYKETGTGTKWAIIRIGSFVSPMLKAVANGGITAGSSGTAIIQRGGSGSQSITAYLDWMAGTQDVSDEDELTVRFFADENKYVILGAGCPPEA